MIMTATEFYNNIKYVDNLYESKKISKETYDKIQELFNSSDKDVLKMTVELIKSIIDV